MGVRSTGSQHPTTTEADGHLLEYFRQNFGAGGGGTNPSPAFGTPQGITATGGVVNDYTTTPGDVYRAHIFTTSGSLVVSDATSNFGSTIEWLVVAGGGAGGGGEYHGGGGGAGGYRTGTGLPVSGPTTYPVVIGAGGAASAANSRGNNGAASVFNAPGSEGTTKFTSTGGGGGGTHTDGGQGGRDGKIGMASDNTGANGISGYYDNVIVINGSHPFTASANYTPSTEYYGLIANATGSFEGNAITASSTNKMGAVITYQDNAGTNTLNTDIVLKLSADNGSNYSTATLTALPNFATGIKMAKVNDLSVTAGTQLKYKIEFANQASGSKEARIRGVSLQY